MKSRYFQTAMETINHQGKSKLYVDLINTIAEVKKIPNILLGEASVRKHFDMLSKIINKHTNISIIFLMDETSFFLELIVFRPS